MTDKPTYEQLERKIRDLESALLKYEVRESDPGVSEKFRLLFDYSPLGILFFDQFGVITDCNNNFVKIIGSSKASLIGLSMLNLPDKRVVNALEKALEGGVGTFEGVYRSVTADKETPVRLIFSAVSQTQGKLDNGIGIIEDITERKMAEDALRESEATYRHLMLNAPTGIYEVSFEKNKIIKANDAMCEFTGFSPEELYSMNPIDILTPESQKFFYKRLEKIASGETVPETVDYEIRTKDGRNHWASLKTRYKYKGGMVTGALVVAHDVTEQRKAREALKESERRFRELAELMPETVYEVDLEGRLLFVNQRAFSLFGYTQKEFENGINVFQLISKKDRPRAFENIKKILEGKNVGLSEYEILRKDGSSFPGMFHSSVITRGGKPVGLRGFLIDITEKKRTQEILVQTEKMMSIGGLAAGMAHEINNPLAGILQNTQVLVNRLSKNLPVNAAAAEASGTTMEAIEAFMEKRQVFQLLENIDVAGRQAARIVKNMLSFSRKSGSEKSYHDLTFLIDQTLTLVESDYDLKKKFDFKKIIVKKDYQADMPQVPCEATRIQQVILNLFKNSMDAMSGAGVVVHSPTLFIKLGVEQGKAVISIEDNGPGMDEKTRKRIFEPFFTTKSVDKGTGLGLSVSYFIIVDDHKGEMSVDSSPGQGARFTIRLPL